MKHNMWSRYSLKVDVTRPSAWKQVSEQIFILPPSVSLIYLQLQLVQQWLPVQSNVAFFCWIEPKYLSEVHYFNSLAMRCDLPIDGQRAPIGWDHKVITACRDVDNEAQGAPAMAPGATEVHAQVVFTWSWRRQKLAYKNKRHLFLIKAEYVF